MKAETFNQIYNYLVHKYDMSCFSYQDVRDAIYSAFSQLQEKCGRFFERNTYIEEHRADRQWVFLKAPPIHAVHSVRCKGKIEISPKHVDPLRGVVYLPEDVVGEVVEVVYTGGFTLLPAPLIFAVGEIAYSILNGSGSIPGSVEHVISEFKLVAGGQE